MAFGSKKRRQEIIEKSEIKVYTKIRNEDGTETFAEILDEDVRAETIAAHEEEQNGRKRKIKTGILVGVVGAACAAVGIGIGRSHGSAGEPSEADYYEG